jgi:hypothetical protein
MAVAEPAGVRLPYRDLKAMLMDPWLPDEQIAPFLTAVDVDRGPFNPSIVPDPDLVDMGDVESAFDTGIALQWANGVARWRRQERFNDRVRESTLPVVVSEGDSWFQFPLLIRDVVDQLDDDYLIWSLDAAGDTADNMVNRRPEYMAALREQKAHGVQAFIFSAAGNDVIGQDATGRSVLQGLVKPFQAGEEPSWHVDQANLARVLTFLEAAYGRVVRTIRSDRDFAELPILVHAYDYVLPGGHPGDPRRPLWAAQDKWLGRVLRAKGVTDAQFQIDIIRILIDATYDMLAVVAGNSAETHVHVVDVRGTLPGVSDWADEIHATDAGFARVADRFRATLHDAGVGDGG